MVVYEEPKLHLISVFFVLAIVFVIFFVSFGLVFCFVFTGITGTKMLASRIQLKLGWATTTRIKKTELASGYRRSCQMNMSIHQKKPN